VQNTLRIQLILPRFQRPAYVAGRNIGVCAFPAKQPQRKVGLVFVHRPDFANANPVLAIGMRSSVWLVGRFPISRLASPASPGVVATPGPASTPAASSAPTSAPTPTSASGSLFSTLSLQHVSYTEHLRDLPVHSAGLHQQHCPHRRLEGTHHPEIGCLINDSCSPVGVRSVSSSRAV
jgi:hypothetical protein